LTFSNHPSLPPQAKKRGGKLSHKKFMKAVAEFKGGGINYNKAFGRGSCGYGKRKHRK
jgi:hypothetical protein